MVHHADTSARTELHLSSVRLPSPVPLRSQHFGELKFLLATLQSVSCERISRVVDSPLALRSRVCSIDSAACFGHSNKDFFGARPQ